ncbi:MAG: helix-turn-helix domain-containing protein [Pseudomonadota bacterium]
MPDSSPAQAVDGRRLRSERSRQAIIDAAMLLIEEGMLVPTAQQIAERAQVGLRSFFRHFADMDALFAAVDEQVRDSYESFFVGGDRDGTLRERLEQLVERRANGFENIRSLLLTSRAQLWRSEVLKKNYARGRRGLRKDLEQWLPELKSLPLNDQEAVDAITSFDMWHRLRHDQGLGKKQSIEIISRLLMELVLP